MPSVRVLSSRGVTGTVRKLFVTMLLTLCVGIHVLEISGRWDRSFYDANDEAGIVAVVLCIGIAISVARTVLNRPLARTLRGWTFEPSLDPVPLPAFRVAFPVSIAGPPLTPLRV